MLEIYNNKVAFIKERPARLGLIILIILILITTIAIIICKFSIYDNYQTKGYVECTDKCVIKTAIPSSIIPEIININNKKHNYEIINMALLVDEENFISYNEITIQSDEKFLDKEIVNINFYYNKQRIIQKIGRNIF